MPRYDETGHEYLYRVNEGSVLPTHNFGTDYTYWSEYDYAFENSTTYVYTIKNYYTRDDGYDYIRIKKEWRDDGETEYRKRVVVDPDSVVYTNPAEGGKSVPEATSRNRAYMSEASMWEGYIVAYRGFKNLMNTRDENNHYTYNTDWFRETTDGEGVSYQTLTEFMQAHPEYTTREQAVQGWIKRVLSARTGQPNTIDMSSLNNVSFSDIAGFLTNSGHHYIVQQRWDGGYLTFYNTRIGVVNYKLNFDWNIGGKSVANVKVSVKGKVNGSEIYSQDIIVPNSGVNGSYYILNLPKYDAQGKIIEYELKEMEVDGQRVENGVAYLGTDHDRCVVEVVKDEYQVGSDSNSDDIMSVTLTNTFVDNTTMTVQKRWFDDNNILNFRRDMYIHLLQNGSILRPDYHWEKDDTDTLNYWKYTFTGLDKYDSEGYRYRYSVEEIPMENYKTAYYSYYDPDNPSNCVLSNTNSVPDGGTITNTMYGEVVIDGKKLWDKTVPGLDKKHYPIAQIYLYKRNKYDADNNLTPVTSRGVKIGTTEIYSGDDKFRFTSVTAGNYVTVSDTNPAPKMESGSIVLPRYDAKGALISYSLDEKAINGYTFKISKDTIVNEYNGGRPVQVTVQKNWENMDSNSVYPSIKLILHQV